MNPVNLFVHKAHFTVHSY